MTQDIPPHGGFSPAAHTVSLMLADARLPSGGHVSSSGVEPALMAGMERAAVAGFMRVRARTTATVDAATAVVARHTVLNTEPETAPDTALDAVERAWAARTPSRAAREIARELGRGLLRLATTLWPEAPGLGALSPRNGPRRGARPPRPLVMGAIAAHLEMDPAALVRLMIYDDAASAAAALLKLDPGDPSEAMALVLGACHAVEPRVDDLASLSTPRQIPAASAPQTEEWTELHALMTRRLFRA